MLSEMGEPQLTIRDYLLHSNLNVTNKIPAGDVEDQSIAHEKLGEPILPTGILPKTNLIQ